MGSELYRIWLSRYIPHPKWSAFWLTLQNAAPLAFYLPFQVEQRLVCWGPALLAETVLFLPSVPCPGLVAPQDLRGKMSTEHFHCCTWKRGSLGHPAHCSSWFILKHKGSQHFQSSTYIYIYTHTYTYICFRNLISNGKLPQCLASSRIFLCLFERNSAFFSSKPFPPCAVMTGPPSLRTDTNWLNLCIFPAPNHVSTLSSQYFRCIVWSSWNHPGSKKAEGLFQS